MRIGLVADAHGNPVGLATCLDALRQHEVDSIYFLGDAVGYLPGEAQVLAALRAASVVCQKGNHEAMLLGELPLPEDKDRVYRLAETRARMSTHDYEQIRSWPTTRELKVDGRRLLLVHGSPSAPLTGYVYPESDLSTFSTMPYDAVLMGNTHRAFVAGSGNTLVANVGSCGLPRDRGDLLAYAVYDSAENVCTLFRKRFDHAQLLERFNAELVADEVKALFGRRPTTHVYGHIEDQE